jgi:hypothetical protein
MYQEAINTAAAAAATAAAATEEEAEEETGGSATPSKSRKKARPNGGRLHRDRASIAADVPIEGGIYCHYERRRRRCSRFSR